MTRTAKNAREIAQYRVSGKPSSEAQEIAERLKRDGYVILPSFIDMQRVNALRQLVDKEIEAGVRVTPIMKLIKGYGHEVETGLDPREVDISVSDPLTLHQEFVNFALDQSLLDIINAYNGTYTSMIDFLAWRNTVNELKPLGSYNWHRDPEGPYLIKSFLYLNDVDEDTTHFAFARGSHQDTLKTWQLTGSLSDEDLAKLIPKTDWIHMLGPAGTVILADTNGYHKGSKGTKERYMLSGIYNVETSKEGPRVDSRFLAGMSPAQKKSTKFCRIEP